MNEEYIDEQVDLIYMLCKNEKLTEYKIKRFLEIKLKEIMEKGKKEI